MFQNTPSQIFTPNQIDSYLSLIKSASTTKYILIPMITPLFDCSLASTSRQIHAHADIYTRQRKLSVAHKSGKQLFGMGVRDFRTSFQDNAKEEYNLDDCETWKAVSFIS